jgi:hypothetical protein
MGLKISFAPPHSCSFPLLMPEYHVPHARFESLTALSKALNNIIASGSVWSSASMSKASRNIEEPGPHCPTTRSAPADTYRVSYNELDSHLLTRGQYALLYRSKALCRAKTSYGGSQIDVAGGVRGREGRRRMKRSDQDTVPTAACQLKTSSHNQYDCVGFV